MECLCSRTAFTSLPTNVLEERSLLITTTLLFLDTMVASRQWRRYYATTGGPRLTETYECTSTDAIFAKRTNPIEYRKLHPYTLSTHLTDHGRPSQSTFTGKPELQRHSSHRGPNDKSNKTRTHASGIVVGRLRQDPTRSSC